jgi:Flp pilus assembly protein TadG
MRRLSRRRRDERGAVAVVVAISMVMLMGFVAISVDVGSIYSDEQQLQNGADAAALAIAQNCLRATCTDSANKAVADKYAKANIMNGQVKQTVVNKAAGSVTVDVYSTHQNWFAGVWGIQTTDLSASATASWGYASEGATLPLAVSVCQFLAATNGWNGTGPIPSNLPQATLSLKADCTFGAHTNPPGGFGWLDTNPVNTCSATLKVGQALVSKTGNSDPKSCDEAFWTSQQNQTVLLPIYDASSGNGNGGTYTLKGLAAFTITGYCFTGNASWHWPNCNAGKGNGNSGNGLIGSFTRFIPKDALTFSSGAQNFGLTGVKLDK